MKKILTLLSFAVIFLVSRYLAEVEENKHAFVISLSKYHYVIESVKDSFDIPLFISDEKHVLARMDLIDRIQLKNEVIIFDVFLESLTRGHTETKDDITYTLFLYQIRMPTFQASLFLENIHVIITLLDGATHTFHIGTLDILTPFESVESNWTEIFAVRHIETLSIDYIELHIKDSINVRTSEHIQTTLIQTDLGFKMMIPIGNVLYFDIPVIIYAQDTREIISGVSWITSKRILSQTEEYATIYYMYQDQSRETL